jgi:two-component sensor histidine kinase
VRCRRIGTFGVLPAAIATPLAMVLTELVQNAVEHGYPAGGTGQVTVRPRRYAGRLAVEVVDDGAGLPAGFGLADSPRLGLQIVRTLVESELGGRITLGPGPERGTRVAVDVQLPDG